jgi:hypothetical protein
MLQPMAQGELLQHVSAGVVLLVDAALTSVVSCDRRFAQHLWRNFPPFGSL